MVGRMENRMKWKYKIERMMKWKLEKQSERERETAKNWKSQRGTTIHI